MILHKSLTVHVEGWCSVIGATHQYQCEYEVCVCVCVCVRAHTSVPASHACVHMHVASHASVH